MIETIEPFIDDVGVAAAASGLVGIALNPRRPKYLIGAAVGIPLAIAFSEHVPQIASYSMAGGYVAGLIGYAAAHVFGASENAAAKATMITGAIGAAGIHPILNYL